MTYAPNVPAVVYQVVPDRFRVGGGRTREEKLKDPAYARPGVVTSSEFVADPRVHCGGDLDGIIDSLPYLQSLRVTGLCLTSIFRATRADKDGVEDFLEVDPAFGDQATFGRLVQEARARGIGIILQGVFNYVGDAHPWFVSARLQEGRDMRLDPSERTRAFFFFTGDGPESYATFHGEAGHVELNLHETELRRRLVTGERSAVHQWLERGAAGWWLARAEELGHTVLREAALCARTGGEHSFVIGDVRGFADRLVRDGLLDGVFNRYLREGVMAWLQDKVPASAVARILVDQQHRYGREALNRSWNFLSSFDTRRVAAALKGDVERARLATTLMYALPGTACIYYGEEVGLGGRTPAHSHLVMDWQEDKWDGTTLALHRRLGALKQDTAALGKGDLVDLTPPGEEEVLAFARTRRDPRETVVAVFNRAYRAQQRLLFLPVAELPDGLPLRDLLGGETAIVRSGTVSLEIPPAGAKLLVPDLAGAAGHFYRNL